MTCVAGFIERRVAYIGVDSAVSYNNDHVSIQSGNKLFTLGQLLIGFSGSVQVSQAVRYHFEPPEWDEMKSFVSGIGAFDFLVRTWVPALRERLQTLKMLSDSGEMAANMLVALSGHLFEVSDDFTVVIGDEKFASVGSGYRLALGALQAMSGMILSPDDRMRRALQAAATYDKHCAPPFFMAASASPSAPPIFIGEHDASCSRVIAL